jgi:hypothetical protein
MKELNELTLTIFFFGFFFSIVLINSIAITIHQPTDNAKIIDNDI